MEQELTLMYDDYFPLQEYAMSNHLITFGDWCGRHQQFARTRFKKIRKLVVNGEAEDLEPLETYKMN